jgi:hypothetical protein
MVLLLSLLGSLFYLIRLIRPVHGSARAILKCARRGNLPGLATHGRARACMIILIMYNDEEKEMT